VQGIPQVQPPVMTIYLDNHTPAIAFNNKPTRRSVSPPVVRRTLPDKHVGAAVTQAPPQQTPVYLSSFDSHALGPRDPAQIPSATGSARVSPLKQQKGSEFYQEDITGTSRFHTSVGHVPSVFPSTRLAEAAQYHARASEISAPISYNPNDSMVSGSERSFNASVHTESRRTTLAPRQKPTNTEIPRAEPPRPQWYVASTPGATYLHRMATAPPQAPVMYEVAREHVSFSRPTHTSIHLEPTPSALDGTSSLPSAPPLLQASRTFAVESLLRQRGVTVGSSPARPKDFRPTPPASVPSFADVSWSRRY
jgi:hypothetical protein